MGECRFLFFTMWLRLCIARSVHDPWQCGYAYHISQFARDKSFFKYWKRVKWCLLWNLILADYGTVLGWHRSAFWIDGWNNFGRYSSKYRPLRRSFFPDAGVPLLPQFWLSECNRWQTYPYVFGTVLRYILLSIQNLQPIVPMWYSHGYERIIVWIGFFTD